MTSKMLKRVLTVSAILGTLIIASILYRVISKSSPTFLTITSPQKTYVISLRGQKDRPFFFTVQVRFDVLKNGTSFLSNMYFHSGDSEDPSFESEYPNHRWTDENTIQFYRQEYFDKANPDTLVVVNKTGEAIKYARIDSVDKVLLFDMQPGATAKLETPRSRGDLKSINIAGEFYNNRQIEGINKDFSVHTELRPQTYNVYIYADRTMVEVLH